jgi:hypothetical protein
MSKKSVNTIYTVLCDNSVESTVFEKYMYPYSLQKPFYNKHWKTTESEVNANDFLDWNKSVKHVTKKV